MDANKLGTCSRDAISLLPDEVLGNILSSLTTKEAASTSLLSKKWRNVFALVHNLDFDDSEFMHPEEGKIERDEIRESFRNFVDTTLSLQCGSPVNEFFIKCHYKHDSELANLCRWICNAIERGVLEMDLSINYLFVPCKGFYDLPVHIKYAGVSLKTKIRNGVYLPHELYTCKTLVKLSLGERVTFGTLPPDLSLPALKTLFIDAVCFQEHDLCQVLLAGCPVLEELYLHHHDFEGHPHEILSPTIKKLTVCFDCELETFINMSFDAPSLVFLDYSDYALFAYSPVNFASLVEARLDLRYSKNVDKPDLTKLIIGISNVETLHLSPDAVYVISGCVNDGLLLPVFNNLVSLCFGSNNINKRDWRLLGYLLKQSPKLETLIIQDLNGYRGDVTLCPYKVKVLHILNYGGTPKELKRLKIFIGETEYLKLVLVEIAKAIVVDDTIISKTYWDLMTLEFQLHPNARSKSNTIQLFVRTYEIYDFALCFLCLYDW